MYRVPAIAVFLAAAAFTPSLEGQMRAIQRVVAIAFTLVWLSCGDCIQTPFVSSIFPTNLSVGAPGFLLTVNGNNFRQNSMVGWNGRARTTTFVNSHQLIAAIAASDVAMPGTAKVSVSSAPEASSTTFSTGSSSSGGESVRVDCAGGSSNSVNLTISP